MKKVCLYTLGCKVNQYESDAIKGKLLNLGYEVVTSLERADFYVINSCAVTNEAERKSRSSVSKCLAKNEAGKVFVIGCAAEKNNAQFAEKDNVIYVNGTFDKLDVVNLIEEQVREQDIKNTDDCQSLLKGNSPQILEYQELGMAVSSHTRAFVKVQDGCNNFCAYCIVPYLRGRSRSRLLEKVVEEIACLKRDNDIKEVVLTGINLSDYDVNQGGLIGLCEAVNEIGVAFRFGSLEVGVIDEEFLQRLSKCENFCPQFHLSLQSGSTKVLKDMNRHYTADEYIKACDMIYQTFDDGSITTDIIVGFPTEEEIHFEESVELVKRVKFLDVHVFPYSHRAGTKASNMKDLSGSIKTERSERLSKITKELKLQYISNRLGKEYEILIEEQVDNYYVGHTKNFIKVYVEGQVKSNEFVNVILDDVFKDGAKGHIVNA